MTPINCAIIEDEPLGTKILESLLQEYAPEINVVRKGKSLSDASDILQDETIQLFFSDIELSDGNIFEILARFPLRSTQYIVFTTAYEEFGAKAFNYPALHYLLKPINPEELTRAMERYRTAVKQTSELPAAKNEPVLWADMDLNRLTLPTQNGAILVDYDQVIRIQASNKYSIVVTADRRQHIVIKPLGRFEEILESKGFLRIHDSHVINLKHLKEFFKQGKRIEVVMSDNGRVPVSHRRKEIITLLLKRLQ